MLSESGNSGKDPQTTGEITMSMDGSTEKQVLCIKWGTKYGADHVNRIYGMVSRNVTPPFRVFCFTDDPEGIRPEVKCLPLPELGCNVPVNTQGKWRKTALWNKDLKGIEGVALFIDLDSVITGSIDPYFTYGDPDDVILARNWLRPWSGLGQTSVFRFPVGKHGYILEQFQADPQGVADRFRYEQHYLTRSIKGGIKFWAEGWTCHFRVHCLGPVLMRYLRPARLPEGVRIVTFPGRPNPSDVMEGKWTAEAPAYAGRWAHLKGVFDRSKRVYPSVIRHLKSFAMPVPWMRELWKE